MSLVHVAGPVEPLAGIGVALNAAQASEDVRVETRSTVQRCLRCDRLLPTTTDGACWRVGEKIIETADEHAETVVFQPFDRKTLDPYESDCTPAR